MAEHYLTCKLDFPKCRCLSCANDCGFDFGQSGENEVPCCQERFRKCGSRWPCLGYVREEANDYV